MYIYVFQEGLQAWGEKTLEDLKTWYDRHMKSSQDRHTK